MSRKSHRLADVIRFYRIVTILQKRVGGPLCLRDCHGRMNWPERGVYFFFEPGENRLESGSGFRVVRVGTHAIRDGAKSTLWGRLRSHKGTMALGGNHRGSVFRLLVGSAIAARDPLVAVSSWGAGRTGTVTSRYSERALESRVSEHIGAMPITWIPVDDDAGPTSWRARLEKNAIALLSNAICPHAEAIDLPSAEWLGHDCLHADIKRSGLWNSDHVDVAYDPAFLDEFEQRVASILVRRV